jgi:hypothetical protein
MGGGGRISADVIWRENTELEMSKKKEEKRKIEILKVKG